MPAADKKTRIDASGDTAPSSLKPKAASVKPNNQAGKGTPSLPAIPLLYRKDLLTEGKEQFFAPLKIPFERRLQTLMVVAYIMALPLCIACTLLVVALLAGTWFYISTHLASVGIGLLVAYLSTYFFYRPYQHKGGSWRPLTGSRFFRTISTLFCQYFPSRVVFQGLTSEQCEQGDAVERTFFRRGERYLCCCHPHGLFGLGVWASFVANPENLRGGHVALRRLVRGANPSFRTTVHTMVVNFRIPVWREWLLSIGFCDVEKRTLLRCLHEDPTSTLGHISCLVPGGAAESVNCTEPILTLKNRKGFVKIALQTGCHLVPVYTFGEIKLYKPLTRNRKVLNILRSIQKCVGIGTPPVCGRGMFNYGFGFLPHREQLTTVIGRPIAVPKMDAFTPQDVDRVHAQYVEALQALYKEYQPLYDPNGWDALVLQ